MNVFKTIPDLIKAPVRSIQFGNVPSSTSRYPVLWAELAFPINVVPGQIVWLFQDINGKRSMTRPLTIEDIEGSRIIFKDKLPHNVNSRTIGLNRSGQTSENRNWTYGTGEFNLYILYRNSYPTYLK